MIDKYQDGADITVMNAFYQYPRKDENTGKKIDDFIAVVYKNNKTGKKGHQIIKNPEYTFYKADDNIIFDHNLLFIEKEKVKPISVKYTNLEKEIAKLTGNLDFYNDNIREGNRRENQKLHTIASIFSSDIPIEDYYRAKFAKHYTNNITKLNKAFFDIEVDIRYCAGDFVELGECPINAIAFHDEKNDIIIQYLLRDPKNPLIEEYENEIKSGKFGYNEIKEFVNTAIGGWKQLVRYHLENTKFDIRFFDNEIDLVREFFSNVHKYQPDFIQGWNSSAFDLAYIIERIKALGYNPEDIMCDSEWEVKIVKNFVDQRNLSMLPERGDYTFISGNTVWIDQMIQFASRRKAKYGSFTSFKLDDIGYKIAKVKKLDYHHITKNLGMLPYLNFKVFSLYNIFDVIVQKCIEVKSQDLEYVFAKSLVNNTSYKKVHRQSIYLTNRMNKEFEKLGYIMGNNVNKWNDKPEDKFIGALVGDPTHTNAYSKMVINGIPIFICESLVDYD